MMYIVGVCYRPAGLGVAEQQCVPHAGSGAGSAPPVGGEAPQSAATHTSCMLVVTELASSIVSVLEVLQTPQQSHTLPASRRRTRGHRRPARDALVAQDAKARQNSLQSAPRPENGICGRHIVVHERLCRCTCQKGQTPSTPRRSALPSPFAALRTAGRRSAQLRRRRCRRSSCT